jgi:prophage antirepressor-like protein
MNALTYEFEGKALTQLEVDGRPAWIVREVEVALGYTKPGRLVETLRTRWADELIDGEDYTVLEGRALKHLKEVIPGLGNKFAPSLMVLFVSGLHLVLLKTGMPSGRRLRRFLVTEVLPKLVRDESIGTPQLAIEREERLAERQVAQLAKWAFEERVAKADAIQCAVEARRAAGEIDSLELAAWMVYLAEFVGGGDLPRLRGPIPPEWSTPTQIGLRLNVTAHRVGRMITKLGLRTTVDGLARPRVFERNGKPLVAWLYSADAEALIAAELASGGA